MKEYDMVKVVLNGGLRFLKDKLKYPKAYEYLNRIKEAEDYVDWLRGRADNLRMLLTDTSVHLNGMPHGGSPDLQKHETIQAEIDELERELTEAEISARKIRMEVGLTICRLSDTLGQKVMIHRFIKHEDWKTVSQETGYSTSLIFKYKDEALSELEKILTA